MLIFIAKVQSSSEKIALQSFLKNPEEGQLQKRAKTMADRLDNSDDEDSTNGPNIFDRYEDVIWIPATSVECERFFSMVGLVFTHRRKSMEPTTLEMILFLKYHRKMLTLALVTSALNDITV